MLAINVNVFVNQPFEFDVNAELGMQEPIITRREQTIHT